MRFHRYVQVAMSRASDEDALHAALFEGIGLVFPAADVYARVQQVAAGMFAPVVRAKFATAP